MHISFTFFLLICSLSLWSQPLEQRFSSRSAPYESEKISFTYDFRSDYSFTYIQSHDTIQERKRLKTKEYIYPGRYRRSGDTLILEGKYTYAYGRTVMLDTAAALIKSPSYLISSRPTTFRDHANLTDPKVYDSAYVALVDARFQDTLYYPIPPFSKEKVYKITDRYAMRHFYCLGFMHQAQLRTEAGQWGGSPDDHAFDEQGRLRSYCVQGWFNMSSIPWIVELDYDKKKDHVTKISHHRMIIHGNPAFEGSCQTFHYNDENSLTKIDFFDKNNELVTSYSVFIVD